MVQVNHKVSLWCPLCHLVQRQVEEKTSVEHQWTTTTTTTTAAAAITLRMIILNHRIDNLNSVLQSLFINSSKSFRNSLSLERRRPEKWRRLDRRRKQTSSSASAASRLMEDRKAQCLNRGWHQASRIYLQFNLSRKTATPLSRISSSSIQNLNLNLKQRPHCLLRHHQHHCLLLLPPLPHHLLLLYQLCP